METMDKNRTGEVLLDWKSTSGRRSHFREETIWLPREHRVVRRTTGTVVRFFGLLTKTVEPRQEFLPLPEQITTEEQVLAYVKKHRRHWLRRSVL